MKFKLSIWMCVLISLVLVAVGLCIGTVRGYADDRAQVTALLQGENGLQTVVGYRAADGLNLCVVARRHLGESDEVAALQAAAEALKQESGSPAELKARDNALSAAFDATAKALKANAGFQADARDASLLDMLAADFADCGDNAIFTTYNTAAREFNAQLAKPFFGVIASVFGLGSCALYA